MSSDSRVAILTLVSNAKGYGPGHTAVVLHNDDVYTFEDLALAYGTSWLIIRVKDYLAKNSHRPVLVQELSEKVDARKVSLYVAGSIGGDADYLGSGVCSTQVAYAIAAGLTGGFDPEGVDTPAGVYALAKKMGIVKRAYYYWPGKDALDDAVRTRLAEVMLADYSDVLPAPAGYGILTRMTPHAPRTLTAKLRQVIQAS